MPTPFFEAKGTFLSKPSIWDIVHTLSKKHWRSSTEQEEGLTSKGRPHLLLLHKQAHDKRSIAESLHVYIIWSDVDQGPKVPDISLYFFLQIFLFHFKNHTDPIAVQPTPSKRNNLIITSCVQNKLLHGFHSIKRFMFNAQDTPSLLFTSYFASNASKTPKLRKSSTKCDNHFYIHQGFFLLHSSCLLNCYIPQGIRLQHIPGPIYGALKVWAWGFNYYELHGSLEFQEIHQTVKLWQAITWAGIATMGILC